LSKALPCNHPSQHLLQAPQARGGKVISASVMHELTEVTVPNSFINVHMQRILHFCWATKGINKLDAVISYYSAGNPVINPPKQTAVFDNRCICPDKFRLRVLS